MMLVTLSLEVGAPIGAPTDDEEDEEDEEDEDETQEVESFTVQKDFSSFHRGFSRIKGTSIDTHSSDPICSIVV